MKVVCDTSTLIKLRKGEVIDCLGQLFDSVLIPQAVKDECQDKETRQCLSREFFILAPVFRVLPLSGIQIGEKEAISLAVEQKISIFITDDDKAFKRALEQGLTPIRTFRVLVLAKQKGYISCVKTVLDKMISKGEGIQETVYQKTLKLSDEG